MQVRLGHLVITNKGVVFEMGIPFIGGKGEKKEHKKRTVNFVQLWDEIATAHIYKNNNIISK